MEDRIDKVSHLLKEASEVLSRTGAGNNSGDVNRAAGNSSGDANRRAPGNSSGDANRAAGNPLSSRDTNQVSVIER